MWQRGAGDLLYARTTSEGSPGSCVVWKLVSGEPPMPFRLPVPSWAPSVRRVVQPRSHPDQEPAWRQRGEASSSLPPWMEAG